MILREPIGELEEGEVTYLSGYHNWKAGAPAYGTFGCAAMEIDDAAAAGQWVAAPCDDRQAQHAVVCCAPPTHDQFSCSAGVAADSDEWPLIPFYYHDDRNVDDLPNTEAEVAKGFRHRNAYFIGNAALSNLKLDAAELCLEDIALEGVRLCVPLYQRMLQTVSATAAYRSADHRAATPPMWVPGVRPVRRGVWRHGTVCIVSWNMEGHDVKVGKEGGEGEDGGKMETNIHTDSPLAQPFILHKSQRVLTGWLFEGT